MQIKSLSVVEPRAEKRVLGGYAHFVTRDVQTDETIFSQVDEVRLATGAARIVRKGSPLHKALTENVGKHVGGEAFIVKSCKNEFEFTVEYKRGYGSSTHIIGG